MKQNKLFSCLFCSFDTCSILDRVTSLLNYFAILLLFYFRKLIKLHFITFTIHCDYHPCTVYMHYNKHHKTTAIHSHLIFDIIDDLSSDIQFFNGFPLSSYFSLVLYCSSEEQQCNIRREN